MIGVFLLTLLAQSGRPAPSIPFQELEDKDIPDTLKKAFAVYRKFPPPQWGLHVVKRIQDQKVIRPVLTAEETEFVMKIELWVAADHHLKRLKSARLIETLRSPRIDERAAAEKALLELAHLAVSALEQAAEDPDPEVARRAMRLLSVLRLRKSTPQRLKDAFPGLPDRLATGGDPAWLEVFAATGQIWEGKWTYPDLTAADMEFLLDRALRGARTLEERKGFANAVLRFDLGRAAPHIARWLPSEEKDLRILAFNTLRSLGAPEALPELAKLTTHPVADVRGYTGWILGFTKSEGVLPLLETLLKDEVEFVLRTTLRACQGLGPMVRETAPLVRVHLEDVRPKVREEAILAVGALQDREAIPALRKLLKDPELDYWAAEALGVLDDREAIPELLAKFRSDPAGRPFEARALAQLGAKEMIPDLHALLSLEDKDSRRRAMWLLLEIGGPESVELMIPHLEHRDPALRLGAAEFLCTQGRWEGVPVILMHEEKLFNPKQYYTSRWAGLDALNALEFPEQWARLRKATFSEGVNGGIDQAIETLAARSGFTVEWPDGRGVGKGRRGSYSFSYRQHMTLLKLLISLHYEIVSKKEAFILEGNRIRIVDRREGLAHWEAWWREKKKEKK